MKTILVSGASGIVGYGILRTLKKSEKKFRLIGTTIYDDSVTPAFCDIFEKAPPTSDAGYIEWLLKTIKKYHVNLIIPGIEIDMYKWVEHITEIKENGAVAMLNDTNLIYLCKDKWAFYKHLRAAEIPCVIESSLDVEFEALKNRFGLPFLLKPRRGFGSKGIIRVDGLDVFQRFQKDIGPDLMAQPIVGSDDEEYTISAFCDGLSDFYASMALKRKLSKDGFTDKAEVVSVDEFTETIMVLCKIFHPIGPTNFQFRKCSEGIKLLEINPRISSSTSIRTAFGYNESAMAVEYFLENKIPSQPKIKSGKAIRYTEDYIFYENSVHF